MKHIKLNIGDIIIVKLMRHGEDEPHYSIRFITDLRSESENAYVYEILPRNSNDVNVRTGNIYYLYEKDHLVKHYKVKREINEL